MSRHHSYGKGQPTTTNPTASIMELIKGVDINQVLSLVSALSGSRTKKTTDNTENKAKVEDFMRLLSDESFMSTVSGLSQKIKESKDEASKQEAIVTAFDTIKNMVDENKK